MTDLSAEAQLQQLRQATAQCRAQALIARQRAGQHAHYYRVQAERFRMLAASTRWPNVQARRLRIANTYERLVQLTEDALGFPEQSARTPEDGIAAPRPRPEHPRVIAVSRPAELQLANDQRQIASAALVKLSRTLCEMTSTLSRETREKLRRSRAETGLF
jgi:hypothetical protein